MYNFIYDKQRKDWFAEKNPSIRATRIDKPGYVYGAGSTSIEQPQPPPAPSTAEAIEAYISGMPRMFEAQLEWQPKLAEQEIGMYQQYLPQVTALMQGLQQQYAPQQAEQQWALQEQYAPKLAEQQQALQRQYEPEAYAAKEAMGGMMTPEYLGGAPFTPAYSPMMEQMGGMMTPEWMTGYQAQEAPGMEAARGRLQQETRGAWAARGLAESGMSAEDEARLMAEFEFPYAMQQEQLTQQTLGQRQAMGQGLASQQLQQQQNAWQNYYTELGRRQNVGLSMAGRYGVPTQQQVATPQIGLPQYQAPNVMQGYNFPQVQGAMQQGYGNYAGLYGNMYGAQAGLQGQQMDMWGNIIGGGMGALGTMMAFSSFRYKKNIQLWVKH